MRQAGSQHGSARLFFYLAGQGTRTVQPGYVDWWYARSESCPDFLDNAARRTAQRVDRPADATSGRSTIPGGMNLRNIKTGKCFTLATLFAVLRRSLLEAWRSGRSHVQLCASRPCQKFLREI